MGTTKNLLLIFFVAVIVRLLFLSFTCDDAYITFRHVDNLLQGNGLVYNVGEKVLGVTSPLYALILALLGSCSLDFILFGKLFGVLCGALACCFLYSIIEQENDKTTALVSGLLCALSANLVIWSAAGLETGMFILLCLLAVWFYTRNRWAMCGLVLGFALMTRIDAGILTLVILGHFIHQQRKIPWVIIGGTAVALVPWLAYSLMYYGVLIPHSVLAKLTVYRGTPEATPYLQIIGMFVGRPDKALISVLALWGAIKVARKPGRVKILYVWALMHLAAILLSRGHIFNWYYSAILPGYLALAAFAIVSVAGKPPIFSRIRKKQFLWISISIILLLSLSRLGYTLRNVHHSQEKLNLVHRQIGQWLHDRCLEGQVVLTADIGYIGYYSGCRLIDWMGLVSPDVLDYYKMSTPELVAKDAVPDFVVLGEYDFLFARVTGQEWFGDLYDKMKTFKYNGTVYHIWSKRTDTS